MRINERGFVHIFLLIIIVIAGIGTIGYLAYKNGQVKIPAEIISSSPTPQQNPSLAPNQVVSKETTPSPEEIPGWKTYTETREVKFTIKYPSTWTVNTKDGMYGEKGTRFDSGKEAIGSVGIGWNSQPVEPNCSTASEKKEIVQIKNRTIEMCHSAGSTQEPEGYFYNGTSNGVNYSIVTSNYSGEANRKTILKVLSTLQI
jgi:hypothetical protein